MKETKKRTTGRKSSRRTMYPVTELLTHSRRHASDYSHEAASRRVGDASTARGQSVYSSFGNYWRLTSFSFGTIIGVSLYPKTCGLMSTYCSPVNHRGSQAASFTIISSA